MSGWGNFAVVAGSATAALLGLLFVAVSIRVEPIARSAELRNRSAQTMTLLLTGLLVSALLAVPQHTWALGVEYLVLAVVVAAVAHILDRRAGGQRGSAIGRLLDSTNPTIVTCALLVVAGVLLAVGQTCGAYFLVPALVAVLVGGVTNAWLILVRLTD